MTTFSELDTFLDRIFPKRMSLNPNQKFVNSFVEIESSFNKLGLSNNQKLLLIRQTEQLINSAVRNFPENIFWDFDFLLYRITYNSFTSPSFDDSIILYSERLLKIFDLFGAHSPIKFRYIHDLIYGYDWLKWMLEKRQADEIIDPFGIHFLEYIYQRGLELISLIQKNDDNYPDLDGVYRNPFLFMRSTEEEIRLHLDLSSSKQIPIEAWSIDAVPKADKNYSLIRLERSKELGIGKNSLPGSHKI